MAVDLKRDDASSGSAETESARKSPSSLLSPRESLPNVESSLDAFIAKANQTPVEVAPVAQSPEVALRKQIEELSGRLAEVESLARPRRWPWIVGSFLIGAASMFAVSFVVPFNERVETVSTAPTPAPAAPQQPIVTPIETAPVPPPPAPPLQEPAAPAVEQPPPPPASTAAAKPKSKPRPKPTPEPDRSTQAKPADKPANEPKPDESGSGLYNPF